MCKRLAPRGTSKLWGVAVLCVAACILGIVYAVIWGTPADGARGGAFAVAVTFLMLFLGRGTPVKVFDKQDVDTPSLDVGPVETKLLEHLKTERQELTRLNNTLSALMDDTKNQNLPLAVASVIGTITAGFGDLIARAFGAS